MGSYGDALETGWRCGNVKSHFFDSGAYSQKQEAKKYGRMNKVSRWAYYDTEDFFAYMDRYACFVKKYSASIDYYANVDAIFHPELTYRNQKYLEEKHGLSPVPVVHYSHRRDVSWVQRYMDEGYTFIGIGGMAEDASQEECRTWIDAVFDLVCDTPDRCPRVHLHGFGITTHWMLWRWPWASVDSTAWSKGAAFGRILVPRPDERTGGWNFLERPYVIFTSEESPHRGEELNYLTMGPEMQAKIRKWLDFVGVPLGESGPDGSRVIPGVINRHTERRLAGLRYFEHLQKHLPTYPWPFEKKKTQTRLLVGNDKHKQSCSILHSKLPPIVPGMDRAVFYYSGDGFHCAQPEIELGDEACVMMTFNDQGSKKPDPRFREVYRVRKEAQKEGKIRC